MTPALTRRIFLDMVRGKPSILFSIGWRVVWQKAALLAIAESANAAVGVPSRVECYLIVSARERGNRE